MAQRDVLSAFNYSLGVTPQPVMDKLWFSLESLRTLLSYESGWQTAMADAWCGLFDAVCGMGLSLFLCGSTNTLYQNRKAVKTAAATIYSSTSSIARKNRHRRGSNINSLDWKYEVELAPSQRARLRLPGQC